MAKIDLSNIQFYSRGVAVIGSVVGNDWVNEAVAHRVARYTIVAPPEGAIGTRLYFKADYHAGGTYAKKINLRYYIGTSDSSHANAGPSSEYTGEFAFDSTTLEFTAENDLMLQPEQTYYLWLFPASDDYGWYAWENQDNHSLETLGGLGLVYIKGDDGFDAYSVHVGNGTSWDRYTPHVGNGTSWDMYT